MILNVLSKTVRKIIVLLKVEMMVLKNRSRTWIQYILLILKTLTRGPAQAVLTFSRRFSDSEKYLLAVLVSIIGIVVIINISINRANRPRAEHLSVEHLAQAKAACGGGSQCINMNEAAYHLSEIPPSAPEYAEASKLSAAIKLQSAHQNEEAEKAKELSRETAQRNFKGIAHDAFVCDLFPVNQPFVSFDNRRTWWTDDGRCAEQLEPLQRKAEEQREEEQRVGDEDQRIRQQKERDEDAQSSSYWPTTVRVNTDMNSFWLPQEERTCQTNPDEKGRVSIVICDATSHANHNIPVRFWGGVDRNTVSDWKCRREGDEFVCRAID